MGGWVVEVQRGEEGCGVKVVMDKKGGGKTRVRRNRSYTGESKQSVEGVNSRRQRGRSK